MFHIQNANLRKSILAAIMLMSLSTNGEAKPKLSEIQGLPQTGEISQIRTGSDAQGNVVVGWLQGYTTLNVDKISSTGVPEPSATTIVGANGINGVNGGFYDLVVNNGGSYIATWIQLVPIDSIFYLHIKGALSSNLSNVLDYGLVQVPVALDVFSSDNDGGFAIFESEHPNGSKFLVLDALGQPLVNSPAALPSYSAVTRDDAGDRFMAILDTSPINVGKTLSLAKNADQPVKVTPYNGATSFDFGGGSDPNKKVDFSIYYPQIACNQNGEVVLAWLERLVSAQRRPRGDSGTETLTLVAQRFNNDLSPKDAKPIVVASSKNNVKTLNDSGILVTPGNSTLLGLAGSSIAMDGEGDFVVAYAANKYTSVKEPSSYDGIYIKDSSGNVMVRQFVNDKAKGKLIAGKAMRMPGSTPKTSHPNEKGKTKKSYQSDPSIVITNAADNEFVVAWHNDYQDVYATGIDFSSILKAARYSSQ